MNSLQRLCASLGLAVMMLGAGHLWAQAEPATQDAIEQTLAERFGNIRPDMQVAAVEPSDVDGIYRVSFTNGATVYASARGDFFFVGDLYQVDEGRFVNLSEQRREQARAELIKQVPKDEMIIFSPAGEAKAAIHVFTDVDCFYCQKLHREVPALNELGVEVRYLAFPRAGIGSESYRKIVSAWCAEDRQAAITALKNRQNIPSKTCENNPVAEQYQLGNQVGVTGTPAMVTESGQMLAGYQPAADLARALGVEVPVRAEPPAASQKQPPASIARPPQ